MVFLDVVAAAKTDAADADDALPRLRAARDEFSALVRGAFEPLLSEITADGSILLDVNAVQNIQSSLLRSGVDVLDNVSHGAVTAARAKIKAQDNMWKLKLSTVRTATKAQLKSQQIELDANHEKHLVAKVCTQTPPHPSTISPTLTMRSPRFCAGERDDGRRGEGDCRSALKE